MYCLISLQGRRNVLCVFHSFFKFMQAALWVVGDAAVASAELCFSLVWPKDEGERARKYKQHKNPTSSFMSLCLCPTGFLFGFLSPICLVTQLKCQVLYKTSHHFSRQNELSPYSVCICIYYITSTFYTMGQRCLIVQQIFLIPSIKIIGTELIESSCPAKLDFQLLPRPTPWPPGLYQVWPHDLIWWKAWEWTWSSTIPILLTACERCHLRISYLE